MKFDQFNLDIFRKAFEIYIALSYSDGVKEKSFCYNNIMFLKSASDIQDYFKIFEKMTITIDESVKKTKYSARLGSSQYPFLKLVLQEANNNGDYGFLVDRHTEYLALISSSKSIDEEKKIKDYTRALKYKIEDEFELCGIPTFRHLVKEETKKLINLYNSSEIHSSGLKVLVVEDDKDVLYLLKLHLELLGYTVSTAENGEDAVYKVHHEINDIMILDLMMPVMNGFDVIDMTGSKIPIIVLSSLGDEMSRNKCLTGGAKQVLTKPVEVEILDKYIKKVLNKK